MPAVERLIKKRFTADDSFIILANLIPIYGVFFLGWNAREVFLVYCLETIMIGIFNLVKMGIVTAHRKTDTWYNGNYQSQQHGLLFMFFFLFHYGFFVAIQMSLFFGFSRLGNNSDISVFNFLYKWPQLISKDMYPMLTGFLVSYGFGVVNNFILNGRYKTASLTELMFQPYMRIFVQQFTVILGSIFLNFGAGKIFIIIFAMAKIFFEVFVDYEGILSRQMKELKKGEEESF